MITYDNPFLTNLHNQMVDFAYQNAGLKNHFNDEHINGTCGCEAASLEHIEALDELFNYHDLWFSAVVARVKSDPGVTIADLWEFNERPSGKMRDFFTIEKVDGLLSDADESTGRAHIFRDFSYWLDIGRVVTGKNGFPVAVPESVTGKNVFALARALNATPNSDSPFLYEKLAAIIPGQYAGYQF